MIKGSAWIVKYSNIIIENICRDRHTHKNDAVQYDQWEEQVLVKIILLGIISIVCIARTSGKTDSGPPTTMMSFSVLSWARGRLTWPLTWSRGLRSQGSSRNVPRFPIVEEWRDGTQSEWLLFYLKNKFVEIMFTACFPRLSTRQLSAGC